VKLFGLGCGTDNASLFKDGAAVAEEVTYCNDAKDPILGMSGMGFGTDSASLFKDGVSGADEGPACCDDPKDPIWDPFGMVCGKDGALRKFCVSSLTSKSFDSDGPNNKEFEFCGTIRCPDSGTTHTPEFCDWEDMTVWEDMPVSDQKILDEILDVSRS